MVNVFVALLVIAGGLIFFSGGGLSQFRAFAESIPTTRDKQEDPLTTPTLQSGRGTVGISSGSQRTAEDVQIQNVLRTSVAQKRKFSPQADKEPLQTVFNNPNAGGNLSQQRGEIVGANLSVSKGVTFGKGQFGLSTNEIDTIRSKDFTDQEKQDLANLKLRFNRKTVSAQMVSDNPEELIQKKREQEAIAKKVLESQVGAGSFTFVGGATAERFGLLGGKPSQAKLFAKPNFIFGGVSEATFLEQRRVKAEELSRIQEVGRLQTERQRKGQVIEMGINARGETQQEFLMSRGIKLTGSALNAKALARLQEKGLI